MFKLAFAASLLLYLVNGQDFAQMACDMNNARHQVPACPSHPQYNICCDILNAEGCTVVPCPTPQPTTKPPTTKPPTTKPPTTKPPTTGPPTTKPPTTKPPTTKPPTAKPQTTKPPTTKPPTKKPTTGTTCYCEDPKQQCANNRRLSALEGEANNYNRRQLLHKKGKSKGGKSKGGKSKGGKGGGGGVGCGDCDCDKTFGMKSMTLRWSGPQDVKITITGGRRRRLKGGKGGGGTITCSPTPLKSNEETDCVSTGSFPTNSEVVVSSVSGGNICSTSIHTSCSSDIVGAVHCNGQLVVSGWSDGNPSDNNYCDDGYNPCDCSTTGAKTGQSMNAQAMNQAFDTEEEEASDFEKYGVPILIVVAVVAVLALGVFMFVRWKKRRSGTHGFQKEEVEMEMDVDIDVEMDGMTNNVTQ